jgi:amidohydrolase
MSSARQSFHIQNVEKFHQLTMDAFDYIWANPETGFKEWKAHKYLWDAFVSLGYAPVAAGNIPGFYADLDTGRSGPTVLVMGELDALFVPSHPGSDPKTGAVHACGHCAQAAALLGLAAALKEPRALDGLCGRIRLMAVPAEELIEIEFREQLRQEGIITYYGGKPEFMRRGMMNGVDMAMMIHASPAIPPHTAAMKGGSNGCFAKKFTFVGRSAHAGGSPHKGINALYAATQGLTAINALRETFQDDSHIRVHPIMTSAGVAVNAIPSHATLESFVRGKTMEDIQETNHKVNRALAASAAALGADVILTDRPGYSPCIYDPAFMELALEAMKSFMDRVEYKPHVFGAGSSDMGDISCVMPAIQPSVGGACGIGHGDNYGFNDAGALCLDTAKSHALILELLLSNDAARAKEIISGFTPRFSSIPAYLAYMDSLILDRDAVRYDKEGNVLLNLGPNERTI